MRPNPRIVHADTHRSGRLLAAAIATAMIGTACAGSPRPVGHLIEVSVRDFKITPSASVLRSGLVSFRLHGHGPTTHELNVVGTDVPADSLPLGADGLTVDEDAGSLRWAGSVEALDIGDVQILTLRLPPGRYVLFCNLEGHYLAGMRASLTVR